MLKIRSSNLQENKCLLSTYFGITLGIFIVIVIGGIIESTGMYLPLSLREDINLKYVA